MPPLTQNERLQLLGLLTLAERHTQQLEQVQQSIESILDLTDDDRAGHIGDSIYGMDGDPVSRLDSLLERLGLTVES